MLARRCLPLCSLNAHPPCSLAHPGYNLLPRSKRQRIFARAAIILLVLQTIYCTLFVAAFALVISQQNCHYPWTTLSLLNFFQVLIPYFFSSSSPPLLEAKQPLHILPAAA